jgi:hypothetical protein
MILTIAIFLFVLALALIIIGITHQIEFSILGFVLLFILGSITIGALDDGITYKSGTNTTYTYTYLSNNITNTISEGRTDQYSTLTGWASHTIGGLLMIAGLLGFIMVYLNEKKAKEDDL